MVRFIALVPLLQCFSTIGGDTLMAANNLSLRAWIQAAMAATYVLLCILLVPLVSWRGAIIATYICEAVLIVAYWGLIYWFSAKPAQGR